MSTHINHDVQVEGCLISRSASSHELVDSRVCRIDLVVIRSRSIESREHDCIGPSTRSSIGQRLGGTCLRSQTVCGFAILNTALIQLLVSVPGDGDRFNQFSKEFQAIRFMSEAYH